jgi:hypothetical protein
MNKHPRIKRKRTPSIAVQQLEILDHIRNSQRTASIHQNRIANSFNEVEELLREQNNLLSILIQKL